MSFQAMAWAWGKEIIPSSRGYVLTALGDQARDCGHCWPSLETIAARVGLGKRQVSRHIAGLVMAGVIESIPTITDQGDRGPNLYFLPIPNRRRCSEDCVGSGKVPELRLRADLEGGGGIDIHDVTSRHARRDGHVTGDVVTIKRTVRLKEKDSKEKATEENSLAGLPDDLYWASTLRGLKLTESDPPTVEWLRDVATHPLVDGKLADIFLVDEAKKFVDYYNAPGTRNLKAWKTAFRSWIDRAVKRAERHGELAEAPTRHDPSLPLGKCMCNWKRCREARAA